MTDNETSSIFQKETEAFCAVLDFAIRVARDEEATAAELGAMVDVFAILADVSAADALDALALGDVLLADEDGGWGAEVTVGSGVTPGNTERVYSDEPVPARGVRDELCEAITHLVAAHDLIYGEEA